MKTIHRNLTSEKIIIRAADKDGNRYIEGYAIVFNQKSKLIREWGETFYEIIEPTAPDNVLKDPGLNVIATVDHNRSKMLGRNISGTLELIKDKKGLQYKILVPNTTLGNDMAEMIERGDYFESSFIFSIAEKGVRTDNSEDIPVRYISDFEVIRDVAIVIDGAYANTEVAVRAKEWDITEPKKPVNPKRDILLKQKQLEIHKLKK